MERNRRMMIILISFMSVYMMIMGRLMQLQLVSTESFGKGKVNLLEESVKQRTHSIVLDDGRGRFVDRNGEVLTDEYRPALIAFPFVRNMNESMERVAKAAGISTDVLMKHVERARVPSVVSVEGQVWELSESQMKQINELAVPGIVAAPVKIKKGLAEHLIGLVGENERELRQRYEQKLRDGKITPHTQIGISGLQEAFDEFLLTDGEAKLLYHVDRKGESLFGKTVKYTAPANPFYPVVIETTLDKTLQENAERIVQASRLKKGGLVLLDVQTSEILAMVSVPSLNTTSAGAYAKSAANQMVIPQFPGSVFKTVVAAAAIDRGFISPKHLFDCSMDLYGEERAAHQMGKLSFQESFARSCNRTFAELGQRLVGQDVHVIETYAHLLGLYRTVGWKGSVFHLDALHHIPEEKNGTIWGDEDDKMAAKAVAQTSVGQKNVRISPLAVANMMATIARGGKALEVKAVREIQYQTGTALYRFPDHVLSTSSLRPETVQQLRLLLRKVVTSPNGTGAFYNPLPLTVAGKSGTAETGEDGRVNQWFAGYFPYEHPRYALVVVALDTNEQSYAVKMIFSNYVKAIANWETSRYMR